MIFNLPTRMSLATKTQNHKEFFVPFVAMTASTFSA
jgi:hypothetical protein